MRDFRKDKRPGGFRDNNRFGGGDRGRRSFGGRDDFRREMFDAVCDQCGKSCQVPFRPSGNKPVLCSECFEQKEKGGYSPRESYGQRDNFNRADSFEKRMFSAVCDSCGKKCEVPFKPSSGKPVYCEECFNLTDEERNKEKLDLEKEFKKLNDKMDRILLFITPKISKKALDEVQSVNDNSKKKSNGKPDQTESKVAKKVTEKKKAKPAKKKAKAKK